MITLFGSQKHLCNGISRRDLLHIGGLELFGLGLNGLQQLQQLQASPGQPSSRFGQAKSCILLYLFGAPSQHDTFDPKPNAPVEVQGELKAVSTSVPGVHIGEGLPQTARILDRVTLARSLTHSLPFHGVHYALSGIPTISKTLEADPNDRALWPSIGSVVDYLGDQRGSAAPPIPRYIGMPFPLYSKAKFKLLGGPHAGFLGAKYDPIWTDFFAKGTKEIPFPTLRRLTIADPYAGIKPTDKIVLGSSALPEEMTSRRVARRRSLLVQFDDTRRWLESHGRVHNYTRLQETAYSLLASPKMARALDVQRESMKVRERFGMNLFGQSVLAARRLVEAGGKFVTVFWDAYGDQTGGWDTHVRHYPRLRQMLLPGFDRAFSALILDLESRGLLDETLIVCLSEHGRTPQLSNVEGGGRGHWSRAYSAIFSGGGMARGNVVGQTDDIGGDVIRTPVSPKDVLATSFHLLGIDPQTTVFDRLNRPHPVAGNGRLRREFLA